MQQFFSSLNFGVRIAFEDLQLNDIVEGMRRIHVGRVVDEDIERAARYFGGLFCSFLERS
jgi:hypothetical protein